MDINVDYKSKKVDRCKIEDIYDKFDILDRLLNEKVINIRHYNLDLIQLKNSKEMCDDCNRNAEYMIMGLDLKYCWLHSNRLSD